MSEADLQALLDRAAIQDVLLRYARGVDRKDLRLVATCFAPDAAYDGTLGRGRIGDALEKLGEAMERYDRTMHFIGNHSIEVAGEVATSEAYCLAHHVLRDGGRLVVAVRYLDDLVRRDGRWMITARKAEVEWRRNE